MAWACICPAGFSGSTCATDIDDCQSGPCRNGGTCFDLPGAFYCSCPPSASGTTCDSRILCLAETVGAVQYAATEAGSAVTLACPSGSGNVTRACCGGALIAAGQCATPGVWLPPNTSSCVSAVWQDIPVLDLANATIELAQAILGHMVNISADLATLSGLEDTAKASEVSHKKQTTTKTFRIGLDLSFSPELICRSI
jgi:hypothetical protein